MRRRLLLVYWGVAMAACVPNGATMIRGDGRLIQEQRSVGSFTGLEVSDRFAAQIDVGNPSVQLDLDENLVPLVSTRVDGGVLEIAPNQGLDLVPSSSAEVRISNPEWDTLSTSGEARLRGRVAAAAISLDTSGESSMSLDVAATQSVSVSNSGGSTLALSGSFPRVIVIASGEATLESTAPSDSADIDASGSARVTVHAASAVRVRASGDARVTIVGAPEGRDIQTSGSAVVAFTAAGVP